MIKHLILQQLYGLSDPQLELQVADRISFRVFLGTTEVIPDYTTVWLFRERLIKNGKYEAIWEEFLNQLRAKGYEVKKGVIQDARRFTLLARWHQATAQIHAGEYLFSTAAKPDEVLSRLTAGDIRKYQVTIPEGFNLTEIAARLEKTKVGSAQEFLSLCKDQEFLKDLDISATSLEGYLFPGTYTFARDEDVVTIIEAFKGRLDQAFTAELHNRSHQLVMSQHQVLTLASIIEKETGQNTIIKQRSMLRLGFLVLAILMAGVIVREK